MKATGVKSVRRRVFGPPPQGRNIGARDEEDLVLFREIHRREKDRTASLLLPVSEEFELTGANNNLFRIPSSKRSSSLGSLSRMDKNDYDWLKTPPATPLFPSLEMEAATAPDMVVQRELPIMHPFSRFSSNSGQAPNQRQNKLHSIKPKTPSTNKPKPSPTPNTTSITPKPKKSSTNHITPHHLDNFLKSNLSKPDPKPKPDSSSATTRPKSRGSVSPSIRSTMTPISSKTEKRSISSTSGGRWVTGSGTQCGKRNEGSDPRPLSVTRSRAFETTALKSDMTASVFGSKMVDKMMRARRSLVHISVNPTMETKGGQGRSSKVSLRA